MKLLKSDLKKVIRECLYEIMTEDAQFRTELVKEALADLVGQRRHVVEQRQRSVQKPQQRTEQKRVNSQPNIAVKQQVQLQSRSSTQRIKQPRARQQTGDLFEALVADTMEHTLPHQIGSDMRSPKSRMWSEVVNYDANLEDGPATRLARAAQDQYSVSNVIKPRLDSHIQQHGSNSQDLDSISLSQLREVHAGADDMTDTDATSIDQLGLADRNWDAHIDGVQDQSFDLEQFASELEDVVEDQK